MRFPEDLDEVNRIAFRIHRERGPAHTDLYSSQLIFPTGCDCYDKARAEIARRWKEATDNAEARSTKYAGPDLFEPREL